MGPEMSRSLLGRRTSGLALGMAVLLVLGAAGCGSDGDPITQSDTVIPELEDRGDPGFVGQLEGTDAFVAVVSGGGQMVAYVCDGDADIAEFFEGPTAEDGSFELSNDAGAEIRGGPAEDGYDGEVSFVGGDRHSFSAVAAGDDGGLFRVQGAEAESSEVSAGWIVDADGNERGSLRVGGARRAAPRLPGATLTVDAKRFPVVVFFTPPTTPATPPGVPIPYPNILIAAG